MKYYETTLSDEVLNTLIAMSADWETENNCYGHRRNTREDIEGNRAFLAEENGKIIGYLFGHEDRAQKMRSVMPDGTPFFEVEELYIDPLYRDCGFGRALFRYAESQVKENVDYLLLSTATKNHRAILHFYLDEVGMEFWSARLFKRISE